MTGVLKILVLGAGGQLGSEIRNISKNFNYDFIFKNSTQLDITDFVKTRTFLELNKVDVIINCSGYTNVGLAESNYSEANIINNLAVENIAQICEDLNIKLVHISTDYIFDGKLGVPYVENDQPNPLNIYGKTKFDGETKITSLCLKNSIIIRTSWLYSAYGSNFVSKIIEQLKTKKEIYVTDDEWGSPTYAGDLAKSILKILPYLESDSTEIYNYCNLGVCSRFQFAKKIESLLSLKNKIRVKKFSSDNINRPKFSALNNKKIINKFNLSIPSWENSLKKYITNKSI